MTTNRLAKPSAPHAVQRTAQEWCDRGNARLAGIAPYETGDLAGQFHRRTDIHWVLRNGTPTLEHR